MDLDSFQELMTIDGSDWNNIPVPLIRALKVVKKCLIGLRVEFKENFEEVDSVSKKSLSQLYTYESQFEAMQRTIANFESTIKKQVKDLGEKVKGIKNTLQTNISTEIEYMKKTYDGKVSYLDMQLKNTQNFIKGLPKFEEIEKFVKSFVEDSNKTFETTLKETLKNWYIDPEVKRINEKFQELEENKAEIHENIEKIKLEVFQGQKDIKEVQENLDNLKNNLNALLEVTEKNSSDIESQNLKIGQKINELSKKNQSQLDTLYLNSNNSQEKILKIVKEIQSQQERLKQDIIDLKDSYVPGSPTLVVEEVQNPPVDQLMKPKVKKTEKNKENSKNFSEFKAEMENMKNDFNKIKYDLVQSIEKTEKNSKASMNKFSDLLDKNVRQMKFEVNDSLVELREKLKWLPINLQDIKGMPPSEARIFILEARIRSEENTRGEQYTQIMNLLDNFKAEVKNSALNFNNFPNTQFSSVGSQTLEMPAKDYLKAVSKPSRNSPTPERMKMQIPKNSRYLLSVDLSKVNKRKVDSMIFNSTFQ